MFIIEISERDENNLRKPEHIYLQVIDMQDLERVLARIPTLMHPSKLNPNPEFECKTFSDLVKTIDNWSGIKKQFPLETQKTQES